MDDAAPLAAAHANPTVRTMRSQRLDDLAYSAALDRGTLTRAARALVTSLTPRGVRRRALGLLRRRVVYSAPPPPDESLMAELRDRYRDEVAAFGDYIGRDLIGLWGYERA